MKRPVSIHRKHYCFYVILHHVISVFIMTKMKGYGVIIIDVWFGIALFFHSFFPDWEEKCSRNLTLPSKVFNVPRKHLAGSGST